MRKSYREVNGEKVFRYSIRKYHFGAASVAVAALMFFANGAVKADTLPVSPVTANTEKVNAGVTGLTEGVPPKEHPIEKSKEVEGDKTTVAQKTVDKSPLVQAISELQAAIAKADEESLLSLANQLSQLTDENKRLLDGENISEEAIASQVSRVQSLTEQVRQLKSKTEEIKKSAKDVKVEDVFTNKTKLETLLKEIDKLDPEKYTEDSVKGLKEKVAKAKEVLTISKNQEEVNSVYKELVNYKNSSLRRVKMTHKPLEENTPKLDTTNGKETVGKKAQNTEPNDRNIAGHNHILNGTSLPAGSGFRAIPAGDFTFSQLDGSLETEAGQAPYARFTLKYRKGQNYKPQPTTGTTNGVYLDYLSGSQKIEGDFIKRTYVTRGSNAEVGTYDVPVRVGDYANRQVYIETTIKVTVKPLAPTVTVTDFEHSKGKQATVTATARNSNDSTVEFYLNGVKQATVKANNGSATWTPTSPFKVGDKITAVNIARDKESMTGTYGGVINIAKTTSNPSKPVTIPKAPKAATPAAPTVASDEANARVTVTPSADADRVEVTVGDATVVATKTGSTWSLTPAKDGVSVDPTSGVITVAHNAASAGTQVSATAKHGNSDASTAASVALPGKGSTNNEGHVITPPTVEVPAYTAPVGTSSTDGEGNLITPPSVEIPEYTAPVGTSSTDGEGNLITPPSVEIPEYTAPVGTSSTDGEDHVITPPIVEVPAYIGSVNGISEETPDKPGYDGSANEMPERTPIFETAINKDRQLPNTGTADSTVAMVAAAASAVLGLTLAGRRKEDEEG